MKRQTAILATFLIAVFAAATIFAEVAAAQQPIAPTAKNNQSQSGPLYYPLGHWYYPPPIVIQPGRPGHPPILNHPPPIYVED